MRAGVIKSVPNIKVLRKVKPDLCFENLSWELKISKQNFGQGKRVTIFHVP